MHADKLEWGWWTKPLPDTLGDKRNYVLTVEEMQEYAKLLAAQAASAKAESERVHSVVGVITKQLTRLPWHQPAPTRPITLADVLQNSVTEAKHRLAIMQFLLAASGKRVQQKRESENEKP